MIHLGENPSTTEVNHGRMPASQAPRLFYDLLARGPRLLPAVDRLPQPVPLLAGPSLPRAPRTLPPGLRPRLHPQGPPRLRQAWPAPAPHPVQGRRFRLYRSPLLRLALHDCLGRRRFRAVVLALLRCALLGLGPHLWPPPHVLVSPGSWPGPFQHRRHHRPPGPSARAPGGRRAPPAAQRGEELGGYHG